MLARVVCIFYQVGLLNNVYIKNVGYKYILSNTKQKPISKWNKPLLQSCQICNMNKNGQEKNSNKSSTENQVGENYSLQKQTNVKTSQCISFKEEIKNANLAKTQTSKILQSENNHQCLSDNCHSETLRRNSSGKKGFVVDNECKKPCNYKKTVTFDLRPSLASSFQGTKIPCFKPYENLVGILKKTQNCGIQKSVRNFSHKPLIIKERVYFAIQSHTRNISENKGGDGESKNECDNKQANSYQQGQPRTSLEKDLSFKAKKHKAQTVKDIKKLKYVHAFHPSYAHYETQTKVFQNEGTIPQLKSTCKYSNNININEKSGDEISMSIPVTIPRVHITNFCEHKRKKALCHVNSLAKGDNRSAFSTSSKKCNIKTGNDDKSGGSCEIKGAMERAKLLEQCTVKKEKYPDISFNEGAKTNSASAAEHSTPQYKLESSTKTDKPSNPIDKCEHTKTKSACDNSGESNKKQSKSCRDIAIKPKEVCADNDKKEVFDIGCKNRLHIFCEKLTKQMLERAEAKKAQKKRAKQFRDPCDMTCKEMCEENAFSASGDQAAKSNCRFVCDDGENPCGPSIEKKTIKKDEKGVKELCKEIIKEQINYIKCSKNRLAKKCQSVTQDSTKKRKKGSHPEICSPFKKHLKRKPKIISGPCPKPKSKKKGIRICESSLRKMLRRMQRKMGRC